MLRIILSIPTLILSFFVFAQKKTDQKNVDKYDAILKIDMQKNLDALTAYHITEDNPLTTTFVAAYFKNIGLQSFIDSSSYLQPFTLDLGKEIKPATSLKINGVTLEMGSDYWPFTFSANAFFAGTMVWEGTQPNQPYLYDLKLVIEKNKSITKKELIQHIKEMASELAAKKNTALIVYNSADVNDNLEFIGTDTTGTTTIPVIYFTKNGIKKLKNESTIATAVDANIIIGEKIINGKNVVAFLNNSAINTVIIAAPNNNLISTTAMLQLAKLLKETCQPTKKNSTALIANNYLTNNYLFINFDDIDSNYFGTHYFLEHLPFNAEKINYAVNINCTDAITDTTTFLKINGINSSSSWNSILPSFDSAYTLKINPPVNYSLNINSFYNNRIPVLHLFNVSAASSLKRKPIITLNDVKTVNYITQLIGAANNKGKVPFNESNQ